MTFSFCSKAYKANLAATSIAPLHREPFESLEELAAAVAAGDATFVVQIHSFEQQQLTTSEVFRVNEAGVPE